MDSFYSGKTILITGASTGIGRALAVYLSRFPCNLVLMARSLPKLELLKNESTGRSASVSIIPCNVADKAEVAAAFNKLHSIYPAVDIAILNAGVAYRNSIEENDSSRAELTFAVNVFGLMYCVEQLLPVLMKRRSGIIAGVSSLSDARGFPKSGFYIASKAAASAYLESLRNDLRPYKVKVITIKPGFVRTPMTDKNEFQMPFLMEPEEAADTICRGIAKRKSIVSFPLPTAAGIRLLKWLPDALFDFIATRPLTPRK